MRNVVGILVAAAVGIHCSAPVDDAQSPVTSEPELAAEAEAQNEPRRAAPAKETTNDKEQPPEVSLLDLSAYLHGGKAPIVTSVINDASGTTFATGTFIGRVTIGDSTVISRGDKDVFLLKLTRSGVVAWVRAVGSAAPEASPRVALEDGQRVTVIGMTKGEMDCGTGPLNTWDSSMFFLCIFGAGDGVTLNAGAFPTGNL